MRADINLSGSCCYDPGSRNLQSGSFTSIQSYPVAVSTRSGRSTRFGKEDSRDGAKDHRIGWRLESGETSARAKQSSRGVVMSHDDNFADLMRRAMAGDPVAIRDFVALFERELQIMVRNQLPRKLRTQYDSVDFVQAVWKSFFQDLRERPQGFDNAEHLRKFLSAVVRNKVNEQHRRLTRTGKYNVSREQSLYIRRGDRDVLRDVVSHEPSPSEEAQGRDRLKQLTAGRSPIEIEVLMLRRQGLTHDEIAARVGINERSVRRTIDAVRSQLENQK